MGTSLDEALGEQPVSEEAAETPAEEVQAAPEPEASPEADATPPEDQEPSEEEPKGWQYAAYKDEKTKRQELEAQLREKEQAVAEAQRQAQEYAAWIQQQQAAVQQQQDPQGHQVQELVSQQVGQLEAQTRLNMSRMMANNAHGAEKVSAAEKAFYGLQATDPTQFQALFQQFGTHQDPIGQIMQWHSRHELMSKMGDDPDAYIKSQAEEMAKAMLAEMQQIPSPTNGQAAPTAAPVMPTDLSQTRNVGSRSGSNWSGPTDLSKALGE